MSRIASLFLIITTLIAVPVAAQQVYDLDNLPDPKQTDGGYVSDPAGYLSGSERDTLNRLIGEVEDSMGAQIAVVIVPSIGDQPPKEFATALFNHWGIGRSDLDNGLLIFSVMDQRRTEFETGYGLEGILPDVICYRIGMQELVPHFRNEAYGQGLIAVVQAFKHILEDPASVAENTPGYLYSEKEYPPTRRHYLLPAWLFVYLLINLIFHIYLFVRLRQIFQGKDEFYDKYLAVKKTASPWFLLPFFIPYLFAWLYSKKLLKKLRDMPRFSRVNGKPMFRLTEEEDNRLLEKGQIAEEEVQSVDYDVWVTHDEDDILILPYDRSFSKYEKCPECGYKTYSKESSRVTKSATYTRTGTREVTFRCKNCRYTKVKYETIPKKQRSKSGVAGGGFSGSSSFGGSSGGGSSWGGGSSGGGGAGVSW